LKVPVKTVQNKRWLQKTVAKHSRPASEASRSLRPFSSSLLEEITSSAVRGINAAKVFSESLRSELRGYAYQPILEGTDEFSAFKDIV